MIDKKIIKKLHEINSMVIKLIHENYTHNSNKLLTNDEFCYEIKINSNGSLKLGFQAHIINNKTERTYIICYKLEDLHEVEKSLKDRLLQIDQNDL